MVAGVEQVDFGALNRHGALAGNVGRQVEGRFKHDLLVWEHPAGKERMKGIGNQEGSGLKKGSLSSFPRKWPLTLGTVRHCLSEMDQSTQGTRLPNKEMTTQGEEAT